MDPDSDLFRRLGTYSWGEGVHDSGTHGRRNRVPVKVEMVGCSPAALKGKRYAQATWLRQGRKREDSLVVVSAYLRPVSATRTQADWQSDLAALSQDILHWQQKSATVVVCGDFNARIGRQGAEANAPSPVPHSRGD
jgi:endonuclease/exonuclease/phosphatase family metal-dependent hydrolase